MPTRPTALRALLIAIPDPNFNPYWVVSEVRKQLQRMIPELREAGTIRSVHKPKHCTRGALLETLRAWVEAAQPGQPHLLYYHGHGGRVSFSDLPAEQSTRISYYLQVLDPSEQPGSALFDVEISGLIKQLHDTCGNVSVIIDSCHSGGAVRSAAARGREVQQARKPTRWIADILAKAQGLDLAAASHPGVVRLTASSAASQAISIGGMGRLTHFWLQAMRELGDSWWRCSWNMLAHRLRHDVIDELRRESQWVSLAGPGDRLPFSLAETPPARAVSLMLLDRQLWLRAGALTGVRKGDRWALLSPLASTTESPKLEHTELVELEQAPQENLAHLRANETPAPDRDLLQPYAAALAKPVDPTPVEVIGSPTTCLALAETCWLEAGDASARYSIRALEGAKGRALELSDRCSRWPAVRVSDDANGRTKLLELLEDRARSARLLDTLRAFETGTLVGEAQRPPVSISIGLGDEVLDFEAGVPRIERKQELWISAHNTEPQPAPEDPWPTCFVALVLIDGLGRPMLLNAGRPEGIEVGPAEREGIGQRLGAGRRGLVIDWPEHWHENMVAPPGDQKVELLCLLCDRPLPLAHLTHALPGGDAEAFHLQGLEAPAPAGRGEPTTRSESAPTPPADRLASATMWAFDRYELCMAGMQDD